MGAFKRSAIVPRKQPQTVSCDATRALQVQHANTAHCMQGFSTHQLPEPGIRWCDAGVPYLLGSAPPSSQIHAGTFGCLLLLAVLLPLLRLLLLQTPPLWSK